MSDSSDSIKRWISDNALTIGNKPLARLNRVVSSSRAMGLVSFHHVRWFMAAGLVCSASRLEAHETDAPFSGSMVDPIILHHAHIENEQRINLELAYGSADYRYGFELFLPVENGVTLDGRRRVTGLGDIEVRPFKYALVMLPNYVISIRGPS